MPTTLSDIPLGTPIVEAKTGQGDQLGGTITVFFRQLWQQLQQGFQFTPTRGALEALNQAAAFPATAIYTTKTSGRYVFSYYLRKTAIDGVASSTQVTIRWVESGVPLSKTFAANANDSVTTSVDSNVYAVVADASSDLQIEVAYASTTPGNMAYRINADAQQLA